MLRVVLEVALVTMLQSCVTAVLAVLLLCGTVFVWLSELARSAYRLVLAAGAAAVLVQHFIPPRLRPLDIALKVTQKLPDVIDSSYEYTQDAMDMENTIRQKMTELPPADFERVLHPAFEEDEIQLILLGSFLGALAGALQLLIFI